MKIRIEVVGESIRAVVIEGSFEEGKAALERLLRDLQLDGIELAEVGEVEAHRHEHQEVHNEQHV